MNRLIGNLRQLATILLVVLVLSTSLSPLAVGSASAIPSGMVGVPDSNITEDVPSGTELNLTASELEGSVMASEHAESLEVTITTRSRASAYTNGTRVSGTGALALVLADNTHSSGRDVAVDADALRRALGYSPKRVWGTHEDGSTWSSDVESSGGLLVFHVPHFSSNVVSFGGNVEITGSPASDGTSYSYELSGTDAVRNLEVNVSGAVSEESETVSGQLENGDTLELGVAGNTEATGPNGSGDPVVAITGGGGSITSSVSGSAGTSKSVPIEVGGQAPPTNTSVEVTAQNYVESYGDNQVWFYSGTSVGDSKTKSFTYNADTITAIRVDTTGSSSSDGMRLFVEGQKITELYNSDGTQWITFSPISVSGDLTVRWESDSNIESGDDAIGQEVRAARESISSVSASTNVGSDSASVSHGDTVTLHPGIDRNTTEVALSSDGGEMDYTITWDGEFRSIDPSVDVDGDGTPELSHSGALEEGETLSTTVPLSPGAGPLTASGSGASFEASVSFTERTLSDSVSLALNGHETNQTGKLAVGETVPLEANESWITDGTNTITVSANPGLGPDDPAGVVNVSVRHEATDRITATFSSNQFTESYNVSKTWATDQNDPTLTIPFTTNVYRLPVLEERVNNGTWEPIPTDRFTITNGSGLVAELRDGDADGDVDGGTKISVRAKGQRFDVVGGEVTVTDPTVRGETLDSEIRLDSWTSSSYLALGDTYTASRTHYTYEETWSDPNEYVRFTPTNQHLHLPGASTGDTARVTTVPLSVVPETGNVDVSVLSPDEPTIRVSPAGGTTDVTFTLLEATAGQTYGLYSSSEKRYIAKATASGSGAKMVADDGERELTVQVVEGSSDSSSGGGGTWDTATNDPSAQPLVLLGLLAALLVALVYGTEKAGLSGRSRWAVVLGVGGGLGLLSLEILNPGSISSAVGSGVGDIVPLAGLVGVGIVAYSVYSWWSSRQSEASTPETSVTFSLDGGKND